MTGWASASAVLLAVAHHVLFTFQDPEVIESSGLVDRGSVVYTINDSGDGPVVYGVDPHSGETLSHTRYSSHGVEDVEAIAPGAAGTVWVGDIGDNRAVRDDVAVYRVRPSASGDVTVSVPRYGLRYPDGARDAETLLVQPRTQRVFVVSKSVFGGTVYAAPRQLRAGAENRLRPVAAVSGLVTDGTFLPDGKHVLLRTYTTASVYTFPDFELVGTARLPEQRQGEGIAVGPGGRVLVSSEGLHAPVLSVRLPASLTGARSAPAAPPVPTSARPSPEARSAPQPDGVGDAWKVGLLGAGVLGAGVVVLAALAARRSRIRSRR